MLIPPFSFAILHFSFFLFHLLLFKLEGGAAGF